jgi:ADP-heptose:LPS heptosyltransferase
MKTTAHPDEAETVLLIRVNSSIELRNTEWAVERIWQVFPQARIATLATPQTETRTLLETDSRLSRVLLFPEDKAHPNSPAAFRRFMARQDVTATVVCFGATVGFDYSRQILSILLSPGRRYLLDGRKRLFPLAAPRGVSVLLGAALRLLTQKAAVAGLSALARRRRRTAPPAPEAVRRILVIRLDHIGDAALSLPAIHALKRRFPDARIDALVGSTVAPLLQNVDEIGEVIVCDAPRFARDNRRQSLRERLTLMRRLRRVRYDLAVDLRGDDTSRKWAMASGAPKRAGLAFGPHESPSRANLSFLLTHPVLEVPSSEDSGHAADAVLHLVRSLGALPPDAPYRLSVSPEQDQAVIRKRIEQRIPDTYAIMHVQASSAVKAWTPAAFAMAADHLVGNYNLDVVLSGAAADRDANEQVRTLARWCGRVHNAAGRFSLEELPALFAAARVMVTVDTGPMHIAAMVGTPVVVLLLPWSVVPFHPYGQPDGVVVPTSEDLRRWEDAGSLRTGPLLEAIPAIAVCEALDRKLAADA